MHALTQTLVWFQGDYRAPELQQGTLCLVNTGDEGYPVYSVQYFYADLGRFSFISPDSSFEVWSLTAEDFIVPNFYTILYQPNF